MTDLRDRIADFDAAARRLLDAPARLRLVHATPATCHPHLPVLAQGMCRSCYGKAWKRGALATRTHRTRAEFVDDYVLLRSEGYTRAQIAERLGMSYAGCSATYVRAVRAGDLTPDRRTA